MTTLSDNQLNGLDGHLSLKSLQSTLFCRNPQHQFVALCKHPAFFTKRQFQAYIIYKQIRGRNRKAKTKMKIKTDRQMQLNLQKPTKFHPTSLLKRSPQILNKKFLASSSALLVYSSSSRRLMISLHSILFQYSQLHYSIS